MFPEGKLNPVWPYGWAVSSHKWTFFCRSPQWGLYPWRSSHFSPSRCSRPWGRWFPWRRNLQLIFYLPENVDERSRCYDWDANTAQDALVKLQRKKDVWKFQASIECTDHRWKILTLYSFFTLPYFCSYSSARPTGRSVFRQTSPDCTGCISHGEQGLLGQHVSIVHEKNNFWSKPDYRFFESSDF